MMAKLNSKYKVFDLKIYIKWLGAFLVEFKSIFTTSLSKSWWWWWWWKVWETWASIFL